MVIFEQSSQGRGAIAQWPDPGNELPAIPESALRRTPPALPQLSELEVVRHYTRLSQRNFSIDTHFYPLGSCTMKYNPKGADRIARAPAFLSRHPLASQQSGQGVMEILHELQQLLADITGMARFSLTPMAGAQGEFAGVAMIRAYHQQRGDHKRTELLVPDAAHGTNPATAAMCGYTVREIPTNSEGDVDLEALKEAVGPQTAGLMLTNPSTLGVFERGIEEIAATIHAAGGLLYYDGANLNAILGRVRPGDMGFDVIHVNLHKTFSTPHGGGGPGAGPVGVSQRLLPFLPIPYVIDEAGEFRWATRDDQPLTIGRLSAFMGNIGILIRAWAYARMLGRGGLRRVSDHATLAANYLLARLTAAGYEPAFPSRRASHEFILTLRRLERQCGVRAMDVAKRLLDYGHHAPTTYFPLLVPECLLIEPTESEPREVLDRFVAALESIRQEGELTPELVREAPHNLPVRRLDEVQAARRLDLRWRPVAAAASPLPPMTRSPE